MLNPVLSSFNEKALRPILKDGGLSLFPYPIENLVGHWTNKAFTQDSAVAVDYSDNENNATLKTGRGVSLDGIDDYLILPDVGTAVKSITLLVSSATDTTVYATDNTTESEDATATIVADGTYQTATIVFDSAVSDQINLGFNGTNYFSGSISRVQFLDESDALIDEWIAADHESGSLDSVLLVTRNGRVGLFVGCTALSQLESPVYQLAGIDWQEYLRFDGVDDYVIVPGMTASNDYFEACTIEASFHYPENVIGARALWGLGFDCYSCYINSGNNVFLNGATTSYILTRGQTYRISVDYNSSGAATNLRINGVEVWSGTLSAGSSPNTSFYIGSYTFFNYIGLIYNFSLSGSSVKNFAFKGYGFTPWVDTTGGGNNGTENGAPARQIVTKHLANNTDALGNPFDLERPTSTAFNVPPGGLIEVADVAAYASVQTVMGWFYYDETDQTFIDLGTPTISAASGSLTSSGITSPTYYINGAESTTLISGWNFIAVTTATSFDAGPVSWDSEMSDKISLYSDEKDATTILEIFNKTKSRYIQPVVSSETVEFSGGAIEFFNQDIEFKQ